MSDSRDYLSGLHAWATRSRAVRARDTFEDPWHLQERLGSERFEAELESLDADAMTRWLVGSELQRTGDRDVAPRDVSLEFSELVERDGLAWALPPGITDPSHADRLGLTQMQTAIRQIAWKAWAK
jgi:hypothetical protein